MYITCPLLVVLGFALGRANREPSRCAALAAILFAQKRPRWYTPRWVSMPHQLSMQIVHGCKPMLHAPASLWMHNPGQHESCRSDSWTALEHLSRVYQMRFLLHVLWGAITGGALSCRTSMFHTHHMTAGCSALKRLLTAIVLFHADGSGAITADLWAEMLSKHDTSPSARLLAPRTTNLRHIITQP